MSTARLEYQRTAWCVLFTAYCLLPTAYCLLPTAYCLLPTAYCLLPTAYCLLPTAYCLLPTAYFPYAIQPIVYHPGQSARPARHAAFAVVGVERRLELFTRSISISSLSGAASGCRARFRCRRRSHGSTSAPSTRPIHRLISRASYRLPPRGRPRSRGSAAPTKARTSPASTSTERAPREAESTTTPFWRPCRHTSPASSPTVLDTADSARGDSASRPARTPGRRTTLRRHLELGGQTVRHRRQRRARSKHRRHDLRTSAAAGPVREHDPVAVHVRPVDEASDTELERISFLVRCPCRLCGRTGAGRFGHRADIDRSRAARSGREPNNGQRTTDH